jgi:hypothetical protein
LYTHFEQLPDQRKARGKRYLLALVFTIIILAKLRGGTIPNNLTLTLWLRHYRRVPQAQRHFAAHPDQALRPLLEAPA